MGAAEVLVGSRVAGPGDGKSEKGQERQRSDPESHGEQGEA